MHGRQFCTPHVVNPHGATPLERVVFDDRSIREGWFQDLLFKNPSLIPIDEIEEVFGPLFPVARELPTEAGPVDVVYINPRGYITLVETKLFRNPEARREVVAQILDYASAMSGWTYQDFCYAVRLKRRIDDGRPTGPSTPIEGDDDPILSLVRDHPYFDETRFIDAVTKNLAQGRFLLLVAGDGIQHGVEQLADTLAAAPALGFTFALLEIALFKTGMADKAMVAQPRVLARTQEIVRAVVELRAPLTPRDVRVVLPPPDEAKAVRMTETAFYEELERNAGKDASDFARWFVAKVAESGDLRFTWSKEGPALWWYHEETDSQAQFFRLRSSGVISGTHGLPSYCARHKLPRAIAEEFQNGLVRLLPEARRVEKGENGYTHVMGEAGDHARFAPLNKRRDDFWILVMKTRTLLGDAISGRQ